MRVFLVAGARPNFVKLAPLWREMKNQPRFFEPIVIHTGQHYDRKMSDVFFEELELPTPDVSLGVGSASHAQQTARIMTEFETVMFDLKPDWTVVFGDVNSTAAVSMVAAKEGFKVAHVEAGLRSNDRSMPEELNRIVTDHLSDLLLTSCRDANENLLRENIDRDKIRFVGNIMIDSLMTSLPKADKSNILSRVGARSKEYTLVTLHRPANVDDKAQLLNLVELLNEASLRLPVVFPMHPRTRKNLTSLGLADSLSKRIMLTDPLGYLDFMKLEKEARVVLTDSGGIQEETTVLHVPCLTLRENTERPVTITDGSNRLVGTDRTHVLQALDEVLESPDLNQRVPPLWDGKTAERICEVLRATIELPVTTTEAELQPA